MQRRVVWYQNHLDQHQIRAVILTCKHTIMDILHTNYGTVVKNHSVPLYRLFVTLKTNLLFFWQHL